MKKTLLLMAAVAWGSTYLGAQITINESDYASAGATVSFVDEAATITPGSSGAGAVWDFSALTATRTVTNTFQAPSAGILGSNFSMANVCMHRDTLDLYMDTSATKVEFWGAAGNLLSNATNNALVYGNAQTLLTFPSTYNTTYTDTASYDSKFAYGGLVQGVQVDSLREKERIITMSNIDGWGYLTVPGSGVFNALRQNMMKKSVDSTWAKITVGSYSYWTLLYGDTSNTQSYVYMTNVAWGPHAEIEYYADSTAIYEVRWSGLATGINEQAQVNMEIYPNPATDYIRVKSAEAVEVALYDLTGRQVIRSTQKMVSVSGLENGTYLVSVSNQDGVIRTEKVVVMH